MTTTKLSNSLKSSISPICIGLKRGISQLISINKIQTVSELTLLYPRFGIHGRQILRQSLHSSSSDEDGFSELDLPEPEERGTRLNLATLKPRESQKSTVLRKAASGLHLRGKANHKAKSLATSKSNHSPAFFPVLENITEIPRTKKDTESSPVRNSSNSITIEQIPTTISLVQLMKAVSEFGEILKASIRSEPDGLNSCDVEFKTMESKERAVASGGVIVKLCHLPIRWLYEKENFTIRISNLSMDTADPAIHSVCMSCGTVEGLSRTKKSSVDVIFSVKDFSVAENIVEELNAVCVDNNRWSAEILAEQGESAVVDKAADVSLVQEETGLKLTNLLEDVQRQYHLKKILAEDLMKLHQCVIHLQNHPA